MDSLWIDAKAKVDVKVADTKFLMLRDVLASDGEGTLYDTENFD